MTGTYEWVLAQAIIKAGLRQVAAGANPIALGLGISKAADAASEALLASATPVSDKKGIAQVATVSSRDEQVGELVGEAMTKVGTDGIRVEVSGDSATSAVLQTLVTEGVTRVSTSRPSLQEVYLHVFGESGVKVR